MTRRLVSVVLPCYNAESFVTLAVASILRQTYTDVEVLAIDDGSTDDTLKLLHECAGRDNRVRVISNSWNMGLIRTLTRGVEEAAGFYVARMDADDLSYPDRITRQVTLLESRPELDVVSAAADFIDRKGAQVGFHPARCQGVKAARFMGLFGPPVVHAAVLTRADIMRRHRYLLAGNTLHTEDYELFTRMLLAGVTFSNIPEPLYAIRLRADSVSRRYEQTQIDNFVLCAHDYLLSATSVSMSRGVHSAFVNRLNPQVSALEMARALGWIVRLRDRYVADIDSVDPSRCEVERIAAEQMADILLQGIMKGTLAQRSISFLLAVRYALTIAKSGALSHIRLKTKSARRRGLS